MTILDKIVTYKREEVTKRQVEVTTNELKNSAYFQRDCHSLKEYILRTDKSGIIAEFKRKSPSKGMINEHAIVEEVTKTYAKAGVSGLSILTDNHFFGGSNQYLTQARRVNDCPILRKDFIISEYQIIEAKSIGADVILLIAAILSKNEIKQFSTLAHSLGMEVLLEIHTQEELEKYHPDITLVGINNRNLKTFEVDFENSINLCQLLPLGTIKIAESGISNYKDIITLESHGFNGFLIGESFMKTTSPGEACQEFINQLNQQRP